MPRAYVPDLITANECTKSTAKFMLYTKISTVIKDAVQSLGFKEIRKDQFDVTSKFLEHMVGSRNS